MLHWREWDVRCADVRNHAKEKDVGRKEKTNGTTRRDVETDGETLRGPWRNGCEPRVRDEKRRDGRTGTRRCSGGKRHFVRGTDLRSLLAIPVRPEALPLTVRPRVRFQVQVRANCLASTRGLAEKAVVPELDWSDISKIVVSEEGKKELASLRKAYEEIMTYIRSDPGPVEPIDWDELSKNSDAPQIVRMFKEAYSKIEFPKLDDSMLKEFESEFAQLQKQAEKSKQEAELRLQEIDQEIQNIDAAIARLHTTTIDEELDANPALARQIDKEISEHKW